MRKRTTVGVLKRPLDLNTSLFVANAAQGGTLNQTLNLTTGEYSPDRSGVLGHAAVIGLRALVHDGNIAGAAANYEVDWTQSGNVVEWWVTEMQNGSFTKRQITSLSNDGYTVNAQNQLVVTKNLTAQNAMVLIEAKGSFTDSTGAPCIARAQDSLTLSTSESTNLQLLRVTTDGTFAGNLCVINVSGLALGNSAYDATNHPLCPWKVDRPSEWKRKCKVQMCDGATPLPSAWANASADTPSGTAFYFWYQLLQNGTLQALNDAMSWVKGEWYSDGSMSNEVEVDMRFADDVTLVCRAGYIPYGEYYAPYVQNGIVQTSEIPDRYIREQSFHLRVAWPKEEDVDIAEISYPLLERSELTSNTVQIVRRALVLCDQRTLIKPSVKSMAEANADPSSRVMEKIFNADWLLKKANNTEESIGTGEWLSVTPERLSTVFGSALNANAMPQLTLDVRPKNSYFDICGDVQFAAGMMVTQNPQEGDVLVLNASGEKVWLKGGNMLEGISLPTGWTLVGYVFKRGLPHIIEGESDDQSIVCVLNKTDTTAQYVSLWQYAITAISSTNITLKLRIKDSSKSGDARWGSNISVPVTLESTELNAANAALISAAVESKAEEMGDTADWWAWYDAESNRIIVQTDTNANYNQYNVSATGCTITLSVYGDMPYNSTSGIRKDGSTGVLMNASKAEEYYSTNGKTPTANVGVPPSAGTDTVNLNSFENSEYCAALREYYGTYSAYIQDRMIATPQPRRQGLFTLPTAAHLGKKYGNMAAPTKSGGTKYKFAALRHGQSIGYDCDGLRQGDWHLHGAEEGMYFMRDDVLAKIQASQAKMGTTQITNSATRWVAQRYSSNSAWGFNGTSGTLYSNGVNYTPRVQAVALLKL